MIKAIVNFVKDIFKLIVKIVRSILIYIFVGIIFVSLFMGLGGALGKETQTNGYYREKVIRNYGGEEKIVLAKLSGMILSEENSNFMGATEGIITPKKIQTVLSQVRNDAQAKGVIFDLNSPGGSPVASDRIFEEIMSFRRDTGIPVVMLMGDMAASGGYYIASSADLIVANPSTITGSIGVIMETYNLEGLYEKLGLEKITFKQGEYKDILNEAREITEEEREMLNKLNKDSYDLFIKRVAEGRKMEEEKVRELAEGKIYSGKEAFEVGLVDGLGNFDEALQKAVKLANVSKYNVVEYDFSTVWGELFGQVKSNLQPSFLSLPSQIINRN